MLCIESSTINWTAVSSIVSFIMVIATFVTLFVNSRQLKEMKRQWKEEHRPNVQVSIVVKNKTFCVRVNNVGNELAANVRLHFNSFFKESLQSGYQRTVFAEIEQNPFIIPAHESKYFYLMPIKQSGIVSYLKTNESFIDEEILNWIDEHSNDIIEIDYTYTNSNSSDSYSNKYSTILKYCFGHTALVVDSVSDAIISVNSSLQRIEKQLKKL